MPNKSIPTLDRPRIAFCSTIRAGSPYETSFYLQILSLERDTFDIASINLIYDREPVSTLWLRNLLESRGILVHYEIENNSGNTQFDSLADKFLQWADICNQCIGLVLSRNAALTHVLWLEADLCYPYDTVKQLLQHNAPIIAPLIYLKETFYDSWAFRDLAGNKISKISSEVYPRRVSPVEVSAVGSFVLFDIMVFLKGIRFKPDLEDGLLVGVCLDALKMDMKSFIDTNISILHPISAWREQVWTLRSLKVVLHGKTVYNEDEMDHIIIAGPYREFIHAWVSVNLSQFIQAGMDYRYNIVRLQDKIKSLKVQIDLR